jgi:Spy/CpxP family protein refolding chaperone
MKRIAAVWIAAGTFASAALAQGIGVAGPIADQDMQSQGMPGPPPGDGPGTGNSGGPREPAQMRVDSLLSRLNLSDTQRTNATAIYGKAETAAAAVRTEARANRQELTEAIKSNDTGRIEALAAKAGSLSGQLLAIESKADAELYATLSDDQKKKYDSAARTGFGGGPGGPPPREDRQNRP